MEEESLYSVETIQQIMTEPAKLEQMAEECCELAHALLKKARKIRDENYTPKTKNELDCAISEEFTDVMLCANVLGLEIDNFMYDFKLERWIKRNIELVD